MNETIKKIVSETLHISPEEVTSDLGPANCTAWDSLAQVTIFSRMISELNADLSLDDMLSIKDVAGLESRIDDEAK